MKHIGNVFENIQLYDDLPQTSTTVKKIDALPPLHNFTCAQYQTEV